MTGARKPGHLRSRLLLLAFLASALGLSCSVGGHDVPEYAPPFTLQGVNGGTVSLAEFENKVIVLDFWATWCPPCREAIPDLIALQRKYRDRGLEIIGVSLDAGGPEEIRAFLSEFNVNYTIVIGTDEMADSYGGILGLPTTVVINRDGRIVLKYPGLIPKDKLEREVRRLF